MSGLEITLDVSRKLDEELQEVARGLEDKSELHAQVAGDAESFIKEYGAERAAVEHKTAETLGAQPTGHLADAYQAIEGQSDAEGARLVIPSGTRLRAAFGGYVLTPKNGSQYLTIPAARDAYGHRAGEFDDLFVTRVGPKGTPVLARRRLFEDPTPLDRGTATRGKGRRYDRNKPLEVMYVLVKSATIKEDKNLIPFDKLENESLRSAGRFLDNVLEEQANAGGVA